MADNPYLEESLFRDGMFTWGGKSIWGWKVYLGEESLFRDGKSNCGGKSITDGKSTRGGKTYLARKSLFRGEK